MADMARIDIAEGERSLNPNNITSTQATGAIISYIRLRQSPSGLSSLLLDCLCSTIMAGLRVPSRPSPSEAHWRSVPGESRPSQSGEHALASCPIHSGSESGFSTARTALILPVLVGILPGSSVGAGQNPSRLALARRGLGEKTAELWTVRMRQVRLGGEPPCTIYWCGLRRHRG